MREHWNDVPGDIAGEDAENLPGGFGTDNPDDNPDAMYNEVTDYRILGANSGRGFTRIDQDGGITAGGEYADSMNTGATVSREDLLEGEEGHPGAGIGFTGTEAEKETPVWVRHTPHIPRPPESGGAESEPETPQQQQNQSTESAGPIGAEGAGGTIRPEKRRAA